MLRSGPQENGVKRARLGYRGAALPVVDGDIAPPEALRPWDSVVFDGPESSSTASNRCPEILLVQDPSAGPRVGRAPRVPFRDMTVAPAPAGQNRLDQQEDEQ